MTDNTQGQSGLLNALMQRVQQRTGGRFQLPGMGANKNKKAPQTPAAPVSQVPTASGGMYQRSDPAQRQQLLQAMMNRSRMGSQPAPQMPPQTPPAGVV
jgi:hypothetical protein